MSKVMIVISAGQISMAIARRVQLWKENHDGKSDKNMEMQKRLQKL